MTFNVSGDVFSMKKRIVAFLLVAVLTLTVFDVFPKVKAATTNADSSFTINADCLYDEAFKVLDEINAFRKEKGLSELKMNSSLMKNAMQRAAEISVNFDHDRPDGSSCFSLASDIKAENIAVDYVDAKAVAQGWRESANHFANIVTSGYKTTGIGAVVHNGSKYWVQVFSTTTSGTTTTIPNNTKKDFKISLGKNKYDLSMNVRDKLFVTDERDIIITGKNLSYKRYFVVNNSCFTFTTNDSSVLTAQYGVAKAKSQGSVTIKAKGDCATITKEITVTDFGAGKSKYCGDNVTWEYNNSVLTFSGSGDMYDYNTEYDRDGLISTDVLWADGVDIVTKVVVEDGVTSLSNSAFACFSNLSEVVLPSTLLKIGSKAFAHCKNLEEINLPESVEVIGNEAFYKCTALTSVSLPKSLEHIPENVFYSCSNLSRVTIPEGVKSIGQSAFSYCTAVKSFNLPQSLEEIEGYAFFGCTGLKSITIPFSVENIGKKAFASCSELSKITVRNPVVLFSADVFLNTNSNLTISSYKNSSSQTYCIDNSLKFTALTGDEISAVCNGYTVVYNGSPVTDDIVISESALGDYRIKFSKGTDFDYNASFTSIEELGEFHRKGAVGYPKEPKYLIDSGTYEISYCIYRDGVAPYFSSTQIVIEKAKTEFSFENSQLTIPWYSKGDNTGGFVNEIIGLADLKTTDLSYQSSDTSVLIVDHYGKIVAKKYGKATITASFDGDENHTPYFTQYDVVIYPVGVVILGDYTCEFFEDGTVAINRFLGSENSLTIPESVLSNTTTTLAKGAFKGASFEEVIIPSTVTRIEENSFLSCYRLIDVVIPDSVTYIGDGAFSGCRKLPSVIVPDSVTEIGERAFGYTAPDESGEYTKIEGFVIYGYKNSVAEKYANENGFDFVALKGEQMKGDVDLDSVLSIIDVTAIQRHIARIKIFDESVLEIADYNDDLSIDIMDATAIQRKIAGLE